MSIWKWIVAAGAVLSVTGIVALVWQEIDLPDTPFGSSALIRWQTAMLPLTLVALGVLVLTAALVLRAVELRHTTN